VFSNVDRENFWCALWRYSGCNSSDIVGKCCIVEIYYLRKSQTSVSLIASSSKGWVCCKMVSDRTIGKHLTTASFFATFACGMTFMFVNNDLCDGDNEALPWDRNDRQKTGADCSLAWGGRCAIAGCVFWFVAFLSSLRTAKILEEIPPYEEVTVIVPSQEPLLASRDAETATNTASQ